MKINQIRKHQQKDRAMTMVSMRIPEDVLEDLKHIAPMLGFSGYQPLIRHYIGQGLRTDLARLDNLVELPSFIESLKRHGVDERIIADAVAEASKS